VPANCTAATARLQMRRARQQCINPVANSPAAVSKKAKARGSGKQQHGCRCNETQVRWNHG
jgi:hypothetical protein